MKHIYKAKFLLLIRLKKHFFPLIYWCLSKKLIESSWAGNSSKSDLYPYLVLKTIEDRSLPKIIVSNANYIPVNYSFINAFSYSFTFCSSRFCSASLMSSRRTCPPKSSVSLTSARLLTSSQLLTNSIQSQRYNNRLIFYNDSSIHSFWLVQW